MKISGAFLVTALLAVLGTASGQSASPSIPQPVTSLAISALQDSVKVGSQVRIKVTLTNNSDHDLKFFRDDRGRDCGLDVRDVSGTLAPDTHLGYLLNGHVAKVDETRVSPEDLKGNSVVSTVKAGETLAWQMNVSSRYDMSKPGSYSIQVQRQDPGMILGLALKSNKITVTVTP